MFQPVGGMDMIGKAFARELGDVIRYDTKVIRIQQGSDGVTVSYVSATKPEAVQMAKADWCVCTIPLSILSQIPIDVGAPMKAAIDAVPYLSAVKIGLQFKRRFWRKMRRSMAASATQTCRSGRSPIRITGSIAGPRGLVGRLHCRGRERLRIHLHDARRQNSARRRARRRIHPQYPAEFENGIAVAWHRVPSALGCAGYWTEQARAQHYSDLCQIDGRIVLAGEHASYIPVWQEGAILSSLDAITRLHERVVKT